MTAAQADDPGKLRRRRLIVFAVAVCAYAGSIPSGFVFDDRAVITENPVVQGIVPLSELPFRDWFGLPPAHTIGSYRPLATFEFWVDWRVSSGNPRFFHALNVVFHGVAMVVSYVVFQDIVGESVAFAGILLAAVLAAPSEAVEGVIGRADLIETIAIVAGLRAHRRKGVRSAALAALALAIAFFSKESGILALPAWALLDVLAPLPDSPARNRRGRWMLYGLAGFAYLALRRVALGELKLPANTEFYNPLVGVGLAGRVFGAGHIFVSRYLAGIVEPWRRLYDCSANACTPSSGADPLAWLGLALAVGVGAVPLVIRKRSPAAAVGLAWFGCFFLPISNILVPATLSYGERLLYIPCIGLCLALASLPSRFVAPVIGAIALVNVVAIQRRHEDWRTPETLYRSGLTYAAESATVLEQNAAMANGAGHPVQAEALARRSIVIVPKLPFALTDLGVALDMQGREAEAEGAFRESLDANPRPDGVSQYAIFLSRHARYTEALQLVERFKQSWPDSPALLDLETRLRKITSP